MVGVGHWRNSMARGVSGRGNHVTLQMDSTQALAGANMSGEKGLNNRGGVMYDSAALVQSQISRSLRGESTR